MSSNNDSACRQTFASLPPDCASAETTSASLIVNVGTATASVTAWCRMDRRLIVTAFLQVDDRDTVLRVLFVFYCHVPSRACGMRARPSQSRGCTFIRPRYSRSACRRSDFLD